jgi:hypothetical protein
MNRKPWRAGFAIALALWATRVTPPASAQPPAAGGSSSNAMSCWWTTDRNAVHIGEPFRLMLTCRVIDTGRAAVVPNVSDIEPTSIQLTPFDVLEGVRHQDVVTPPWRYLQFVYSVRLLGDEFFGRDVAIPPTNVRFRIRTGTTEAAEGVEHTYVLPSIPVRVVSLLPAQATDIRDPSPDTFGDVEARRSRSTVALVAGTILLAFAAVLLLIAGVRGFERFRKRGPAVERTVPAGAVLGGCLREVDRVRSEAAREGWTSGLAARALAPFRVAAAIALAQPVSQTLVTDGASAREGQLTVSYGMLRRRRAFVSAPITADTIDRLRVSSNGRRSLGRHDDLLDAIRGAMADMNAVRYGRDGAFDQLDLDQTLDQGAGAVRRLRARYRWPARVVDVFAQSPALRIGSWGR